MSARIRSATGSAGNRTSAKILKSSGSSRALLNVNRIDDLVTTDENLGLGYRGSGAQHGAVASGEERLRLSDEELREEITKTLTTVNPQAPVGLVEFSFKERCYVSLPPPSHSITLLHVESTCLYRDSKEAQEQLARTYTTTSTNTLEAPSKSVCIADVSDDVVGEDEVDGGDDVEEGDADADAVDDDIPEVAESVPAVVEQILDVPVGPTKKLTNQFNFCDRAALTYNNPSRDLGTQTVPPPRTTFSVNLTQWEIYDAYQEDYEQQQKGKEKNKEKSGALLPKREDVKKRQEATALDNCLTRQLLAVKIIERMVNQNTYDEIAQDFKYWEDPSDEFREEEGTLLPLWKILYEKAKDYNVMSLCWNPQFQDLFAVGFGSFDFREQKQDGMMCVFTLKTPSHPEYQVSTESGVMSVDIHPSLSHLIVLGLYDGNVEVYDLQVSTIAPQYRSNSVSSKHTSTVWQVRWGRDAQESEQNFYSVAADGQVLCWTLLQHELAHMTVISLNLATGPLPSPDGSNISLVGCGTALAFHPKEPMIFLVGTEEGRIYKCSTAYTSIFLAIMEAHYMPVHQIDYNKFDPSIYASCSGDWRVKIWEDNRVDPLFEFDLASPVGDVAWAPYSSTVFAAATADGKVHVFDLNVNKYRPICMQTVVAKKRCCLTRLAFNPKHPVIIVGDNSGCITSVKLSPNLRKKQKPPKKGVVYEHETLEKIKLEKLLALVRDPQNPATVLDIESTT